MTRKILTAIALLSVGSVYAQKFVPCITDEVRQENIHKNPELLQIEAEANQRILANQQVIEEQQRLQKSATIRYIPVVFHIIHNAGFENITQAQIMDQIRILNEDYRKKAGTNGGKSQNPLAADIEFEFRLAQYDPNGNKHDGINRIQSTLTENARDNVKALSYWNSDKYLNVWVVKSIDPQGVQGTVLGYAQFPWQKASKPTTDGIVVRYDQIGVIGSGMVSQAGRTLTHEIGHWMGLYHTFQDGCTGNTSGTCASAGDRVCDTPPVATASSGCNTGQNSCTNDSPDVNDLIEDYMDYSDGTCMELFTAGQKSRMHSSMSQYRATLYTNSINYAGISPGTGDYLVVSPAPLKTPAAYDFESGNVVSEGWVLNNFNNPTNGWQVNDSVGYQSNSCMYMHNFANPVALVNARDGFQTPEFDLTGNTTPFLEFYYAYAQKSTANNDSFSVTITNNFGMNETRLFSKGGADLATADIQTTDFVPTNAQWKKATINLWQYAAYTNARFRFELLNRRGNNIYVDNVMISNGPTGIDENMKADYNFNVMPNPAHGQTTLTFDLKESAPVNIVLRDLVGREVKVVQNATLSGGNHKVTIGTDNMPAGVYFIQFEAGQNRFAHKLLIN